VISLVERSIVLMEVSMGGKYMNRVEDLVMTEVNSIYGLLYIEIY